jgi:multicomponent Na+:H+ antiporter subunit E
MRFASLTIVLLAFWLMLSGHYNAITLTCGVVSVLLVAYVAQRMGAVDDEGHPIRLLPRTVLYYPWLAVQIFLSAWDVMRLILGVRLNISPVLVRVRTSQKTPAGLVTYANSITLTPGTLTARCEGHEFLVHALTRKTAESLLEGEMDRRVTTFENAP